LHQHRRLCNSEDCRRAWVFAEHQASQKQRQAELEARIAAWRDSFTGDVPDASSFCIALVPYNPSAPLPLPDDRREKFRAHLANVAAEAFAAQEAAREADAATPEPAAAEQVEPNLAAMFHACGACRGLCCRNGHEHAYLTSATVQRYLRAFPGSSLADLMEAYLSRLPAHSLELGCVFQEATGCALPRSLRSDTCNDYYCPDLRVFEQRHDREQPVRAFFAACADNENHRAVFVAPALVQLVEAERGT
jgi:hypothetical protein